MKVTKKQLLNEIELRSNEPINELVVACWGCGETIFCSEAEKMLGVQYSDGSNVYLCKPCNDKMVRWESKADKDKEWIAELDSAAKTVAKYNSNGTK